MLLQDEEPPVFLAYQPYKGPASIPHVPGDFFGAFFLATNVRDASTACIVLAAVTPELLLTLQLFYCRRRHCYATCSQGVCLAVNSEPGSGSKCLAADPITVAGCTAAAAIGEAMLHRRAYCCSSKWLLDLCSVYAQQRTCGLNLQCGADAIA